MPENFKNRLQVELCFTGKVRLPRYDSPKTDNERLLTYQAEWLEDGSDAAREQLWNLAVKVARRCAAGVFRMRKIKFTRDDVDDVACEGILYVFRRYKSPLVQQKRKGKVVGYYIDLYGWNYCVLKDYVSVIKNGVRHAIDYRTKADRLVDFVDGSVLEIMTAEKEFLENENYGMP
ncbi:MAG: hypothetical protein J6Y93_02540 [Treponema sp.]|nr:hypothetical protein [Treponema sp.]